MTEPDVLPTLDPDSFRETARTIEDQIGRVIVGQQAIVRAVLMCVIAGGHALLEGVPGLGKTVLVRTLGQVLDLKFSRIQFTPDLMPSDIVGTHILIEEPHGGRVFRFQPGPLFANLVLADEINRATPKTQSALLEAMQEKTVSVANTVHRLEPPFFVLATQNPIEMEGTYPLPEAQLDRFFFKLLVGFPGADELSEILQRTTGGEAPTIERGADGPTIRAMQGLAAEVPIASHVLDYAVRLVMATHPEQESAPPAARQFVRFGSSPRGAQAIVLAAKINALLAGRWNVAFEDVRLMAHPALRHRLILNFEAESEGISADKVIDQIIEQVPEDVAERGTPRGYPAPSGSGARR